MTGVAAIALCAAFTSCSKGDELYDANAAKGISTEQAIAKVYDNYNQAFIKTFGQPAANQDWGFGSSASTRVAEPNRNQWFDGVTEKFKHLVQPADVTAREEQVVTQWFKDNQHPTCDPIYLREFFVQQVHFGDNVYTAEDANHASHSVTGGNQMDWLFAYSPTPVQVYLPNGQQSTTTMDHINNFNTNSPARTSNENTMLMMNSSTENFGFHESYNTQTDRYYNVKDVNWVIKAIEVDGVVGYYVGFDYESHGNQGDFLPDGYFDDRIIKIVPGDGIIPGGYDFRVIAEDLNAAALDAEQAKDGLTDSDWDFNDVVFDVKYKNDNTAIVKVRVVGGILPLYIGTAANPKLKEVHQLFGQTPNAEGQYSIIGARDSEEFEVAGVQKSQNGKDIRISVARQLQGGEEAILELKAERGLPAAKIRVKTTFTPCGERDDIRTIYPNFSAWVQSNDPNMTWY